VSDDEQPRAAETDGRTSVVRSILPAVALVAVVSLAFWGIGTLRDEAGTPVVAEDPEVEAPADEAEEPTEPQEPEEPEPEEPEDQDGTDGDEPEPDADEDDADAGDADAGDADAGDADEDDADEDDASTDRPRAVAPGDVTIQVLDGVKDDGGTAADDVATLLDDVGYRIIARNDALTYEVTTVLYNPGNEAAAEQVAADLGGAEVRPQPGNLSTAVALHVVVGRDRA
jgi:hypothetical protein